jgi:dTDP-4-amino-4,6-dideoxygalactose transaminase
VPSPPWFPKHKQRMTTDATAGKILERIKEFAHPVRTDALCLGNQMVDDLELMAVTSVIKRRALFRYHKVDRCSWVRFSEKAIREMLGSKHCLLLPSASSGLDLLFDGLGIKQGARVVTSPFGWVAIYSSIQRRGATLGFYDLDDSLQIDLQSFEEAVKNADCAIVPHMLGRAQQQISEIAAICRKRGVPLIEDIAQSFGVRVGPRSAGTFGDAAYCSLNHHKVLGTGDGGFILTNRDDLFEAAVKGHDQGCIQVNGKRRITPERFIPGNSLRATELMGAALAAQIARFPLMKRLIQNLYEKLHNALLDTDPKEIPPAEGDLPYVYFFENRPGLEELTSLADSGWHLVWKVPPSSGFQFTQEDRKRFERLEERLKRISLIGCGFVDDFFSTPIGASLRP